MQGNLINTAIIAEGDALFLAEVNGARAVLDALAADIDPSWGLDAVPALIQDATVSILRAAGGLVKADANLREALSELAWAYKLSQPSAPGSGWDLVEMLDSPLAYGAMGAAS